MANQPHRGRSHAGRNVKAAEEGARKHEVDEDEAAWDKRLKKVVKHKPVEKQVVSEFLAWVPLIIIFVVAWIGSGIITAINTANLQRHEDHLEMMERLAEIASDISDLNGTVDGLGRRYDPPDLSDYD